VSRLRTAAVLVGGAFAGIGGAALSLGTLNHFEHHMPSGLGFMALAAVVFGRWRPINAGGAALFFSFGNALRLSLTSSFPAVTQWIPGGLLLAVPYLLTLLLLSLRRQGGEAPAALGQPYAVEQR
jgi:general nucleoside transport system permease protein